MLLHGLTASLIRNWHMSSVDMWSIAQYNSKGLKISLGKAHMQPLEKLNDLLNMADVQLVMQKANASDLVMPSKLTGILSVGGVALVTTSKDSSLYDMVCDNNIGVVIEPESRQELTHAIEDLIHSDKEKISRNAFRYANEFLSIEKVFSRFTPYLQ